MIIRCICGEALARERPADRVPPPPSCRSLFPCRALHRDQGQRDLRCRHSADRRPRLCRSRSGRVLSEGTPHPADQEAATAGRNPAALARSLRRWVRLGIAKNFLVEWQGKPIKSVRTAWNNAREEAGLGEDVVRHTLRHTAATWLMQGKTSPWEASGFLGMSVETLIKHYGHHHPDYQQEAAANICRPPMNRPGMRRTDQEQAGAIRSEKPQRRRA